MTVAFVGNPPRLVNGFVLSYFTFPIIGFVVILLLCTAFRIRVRRGILLRFGGEIAERSDWNPPQAGGRPALDIILPKHILFISTWSRRTGLRDGADMHG